MSVDANNKKNGKVEVEKKTLGELMELQLAIPEYQRRYCWGKEQVDLLLQDINLLLTPVEADKPERPPLFLGTIIVHLDNSQGHEKANLVDGQQRSMTLVLLLHAMKCTGLGAMVGLMQAVFPDSESQKNLLRNFQYIQHYLKTDNGNKFLAAKTMMLNRIEFVLITIDDIDQAFTFFDSQNTSGKRLTDFDLLKARHLRGVISDASVGIGCSHMWECYETLKVGNGQRLVYFLTEQILARTRVRQRGKKVDNLSLEKEFTVYTKDKDLNQSVQLAPPTSIKFYRDWQVLYNERDVDNYPFSFVTQFDIQCEATKNHTIDNVINLPLQLNQPLMGGEQFFFYIAKYTELYRKYFPLDIVNAEIHDKAHKKISEPKEDDPKHWHVLHHQRIIEKSQSAGYSRLLEIWLASVVFYLDRFGEDINFNNFALHVDQYVFSLRITEATLRRSTVENFFHEAHFFDSFLQCPTSHQAILLIEKLASKQIDVIQSKDDKWVEKVKKSYVIKLYIDNFLRPQSVGEKIYTGNYSLLFSVLREKLKFKEDKNA